MAGAKGSKDRGKEERKKKNGQSGGAKSEMREQKREGKKTQVGCRTENNHCGDKKKK